MTSTVPTDELLPCPFCGGEANIIEYPAHSHSPALVAAIGIPDHPGSWASECQRCGCGLIHATEAEAIAAWNRRTPPASAKNETGIEPIATFEVRTLSSNGMRGCTHLMPDLWWSDFKDGMHPLYSATQLAEITRQRDEALALVDRLKMEAVGHAGEARTANATIYEIYQVLTGATGEPGNWNGAQPARKYVERTTARIADLEAQVKAGAVPEGWKLVPWEPTDEMVKSGYSQCIGSGNVRGVFSAMLAASPQAPGVEE